MHNGGYAVAIVLCRAPKSCCAIDLRLSCAYCQSAVKVTVWYNRPHTWEPGRNTSAGTAVTVLVWRDVRTMPFEPRIVATEA
eukprot:scaffold663540_cov57-Prasinocladus_malaysianus.AAC.1